MTTPFRLALASTFTAALLLAGCARKTETRPAAPATSQAATSSGGASTSARQAAHHTATPSDAGLPEQTGIPACDDYLSSYLACHRAAGIFSAEQLPSRYEAMRTKLLRDSQDPDVRPQLAGRCNSLARSLREALHGKSCAANPAPAGSTP
ncbi:MAG: hypothetical protein WBA33_06580 [Rhodanobacter lindaniclasticus]